MKYRREIDGLRALAVVPVILFHAGFPFVGGGYVGVDVFFVISGYLITSIIISELSTETFSLARFYERRARRILPALFFMMAVTVPFAWVWLLPEDMKDYAGSVFSVPLFLSNHLFLSNSGYFDTAAELKPLLHTWSLAVEEQYYTFFPLLLLLVWRFGRFKVIALLGLLAIGSISLAQWNGFDKPATAFFVLPTRSWELLVGSFAAFYLASPGRNIEHIKFGQAGSLFGVVLVLFSVVAFDKNTPFPGLYALVPTVGAVLIIIFAGPGNVVGRALGSTVLVSIGLLSYSAYLWHQPIFVFARHGSMAPPSGGLLLVLILLSFALAFLSWRFVETPFRQVSRANRSQLLCWGGVGAALFIAFGLAGHLSDGFKFRIKNYEQIAGSFSASGMQARSKCTSVGTVKAQTLDFCVLGPAASTPVPPIAVFGDSHAEALIPAFERSGRGVVYSTLGGCPPLLGVDVLKGNFSESVCSALAERQYEYVKKNGIKKLFLVARWSLYTDGEYDSPMDGYYLSDGNDKRLTTENSRKVFRSALDRTINEYKKVGTKVIIIFQIPQQIVRPNAMYTRLLMRNQIGTSDAAEYIDYLSIPFSKHMALQSYSRSVIVDIAERNDVAYVNLDSFLCNGLVCQVGDTFKSFYRDADHLNEYGAARVTGGLVGNIL